MNQIFSVTDFVAVCNQVLDYSFGSVQITGEISQLKISKNRWVYFDLKDQFSNLRFFGSIYNVPGPLEDGMNVVVQGLPQLHPKYGFSVNVQSIQFVGEGTIKKAAQLLELKLEKEGVFDPARKRVLPYPPEKIALISSGESAGHADFVKILTDRWPLVDIEHIDVHVQGEKAVGEIIGAVGQFNEQPQLADVLVIIRGGGSLEDLQAFSTEQVTRAVASSRIPTIVAIGHEIDLSLAEKVADKRASTPSNAAELLVPDKNIESSRLQNIRKTLYQTLRDNLKSAADILVVRRELVSQLLTSKLQTSNQLLLARQRLVSALNPQGVLNRGFSIIRQKGSVVKSVKDLQPGGFEIQFKDGRKRVQ